MSAAVQMRTSAQPRNEIVRICEHLLDGYGSFFGLENPISKILLVFCTFIFPATGFGGVLGGLSVILARRVLRLSSYTEGIEIVNGILLGMLVGSTYAFDLKSLALLLLGATVLVITSAVLTDTITRYLRLPLLGLPYVIAAYVIMPIGTMLQLLPSSNFHLFSTLWLACPLWQYLPSFGAIYFNGTVVGGILTLFAFLLSSRYLALLGLASAISGTILLEQLSFARGLIAQDPILFLVAQMNGLLTACVVGGLYTIPSKRSIVVALASGILASLMTITLNQILWPTHLPVLALPFVLTTYAVLMTLSPQHGAAWSVFWLLRPCLAERSLEQIKLAQARGVDLRSVSLKPPFSGAWQVYQGFNGKHTHQGIWRYALDFFQTESHVSYVEDGSELAHYHCYAKPVLSPVYGRVYKFVDTCNDNLPGQVDTVNNWGNYIMIEIGFAKYVVLAHLQKESIRVKVGDYVVPGQMLALCGNSGRSPQPHLHMHVQESPEFGSRTIPFHLSGVIESTGKQSKYTLSSVPKELETLTVPLRNAALKKAFKLAVGNRLEFEFHQNKMKLRKGNLHSELDATGQFYLVGESGARVAYTATDDLVAFYGRVGPKDALLDAFILGVGLTPLTEGTTYWQDLTPVRLLPLPWTFKVVRSLFSPFSLLAESNYERAWNPRLRRWVQEGTHELSMFFGLIKWSCKTEVHLCETLGVLYLEVSESGVSDPKVTRTATLAGQGIREDNGIPERSSACLPST